MRGTGPSVSEETVAQRVVDELDTAIAIRDAYRLQRDAMLDILNAILLAAGGSVTVTDEYTFGQPRREVEVDRQPGRMIVRFAPVAGPVILNSAGAPIARA